MKSESVAIMFNRKPSTQTTFTKVSFKKQGYSFICVGLSLIKSKVLPRYLTPFRMGEEAKRPPTSFFP